MEPELKEFAKLLVQLVRDEAIQNSDFSLSSQARGPTARRWQQAATHQSPLEFARTIIPDIVDETVFYLLNAIDNGSLKLTFATQNGTQVDLTKDGHGELAGWYLGSDGWRAAYSKERFVDDFPTSGDATS
ncbi:MAG TPA: hypothetical protein VL175_13785 [Pirellulales bacterium]|jgi:hypothetical protein|nr:hypothetical protein [Pirellulales bacterium]